MLLSKDQSERVFGDTFEERIELLHACARERNWSIVSTKTDSAHLVEEDGRLAKRKYTIGDDGEVTWGRAYYLETFPSSDAVGLVAKGIRDLAKQLIKGQDIGIGEGVMRQLSIHAKDYMSVSEAITVLEGGEMSEYYEEHKSEVRKSCRGSLGEIESKNRLTYYEQMSAQRQNDHIEEIKSVLTSCAYSLDRLECHGTGRVFEQIASFKERAIKASAIIKHSGQPAPDLARAADTFSRSLLTANILKDFAVRTENTEGE